MKSNNIWLFSFILLLLCNFYVIRLAFVFGESMKPTLDPYDCVIIWQLAYTPVSGDIVVTDADNAYSQNIVKRVIATEGQHICIDENVIYVDGAKLQEPYLASDPVLEYAPMDIIVPADKVFLLGDNRNFSKDSREIGCFEQKSIKGKVVLRFLPFEIF